MTPAGWYPDPRAESRYRYWDGSSWTVHYRSSKPTKESTSQKKVFWSVCAATTLFTLFVGLAHMSDRTDDINSLGFMAFFLATGLIGGALLGGFIAFITSVESRGRTRREKADRARTLAANADAEHAAMMQGDERRGLYGQFQPPPLT